MERWKDFFAWVTEHLKCRWEIIYVPRYRTSLTQGRLWPFEVVMLAHFRSCCIRILAALVYIHTRATNWPSCFLFINAYQLSSIFHTHGRGYVVRQWNWAINKISSAYSMIYDLGVSERAAWTSFKYIIICYLVKFFFLFSVCYYQIGDIKLYSKHDRWQNRALSHPNWTATDV